MIFDVIANLKDSFKKEPIALNIDETSAKSIIDQYNDMKISADAFIERTGLSDEAMQSYLHTVESGNATFSGCTQYVNSASNSIGLMGIKAKATTILVQGLKAAVGMIGVMLLSRVIEGFIIKLDDVIHKSEKIAESAEKARNTIDELNKTFEENKTTVDDIKKRYAELAQGVDLLTNKNLTLSNDDYNEFLDLSNRLIEIFPNLTRNYDNNGNAILNLEGDVNSIVKSLDELIERQQQLTNNEILEELPDVYSGYKNSLFNYEEELSNAEEIRDLYLEVLEQINDESIASGNRISFNLSDAYSKHATEIYDTIVKSIPNYEQLISEELDYSTNTYAITIQTEGQFEGFDNTEIQKQLDFYYDKISEYNYKIQNETSSFSSYMNTWLQGNWLYQQQDSKMQEALKQVLFDKDWIKAAAKDNVNTDNWNAVSEWVEENYIRAIQGIDDEEIKQSFIDLFTLDLTPQAKIDLAQQLQDYFDKNEILISLDFILDENDETSTQNLVDRFNNSLTQISGDGSAGYDKLSVYTKDFSEEQMQAWLEATNGATNAEDAILRYEESLNAIKDQEIDFFTEDNLENIDEYKDKISNLSVYLQSINDKHGLSAEEIATLNIEYGIVANSVEEYKQKIIDLINKTVLSSEVMMALKEAIEACEDTIEKERLQSLYDILSKLGVEAQESADEFGTLETAISSLQSKANLLRDVNEGIKDVGYIDSSKLDDIASAYPGLINKVAEYNAGLITSEELFGELKSAYEKDAKNYKLAVVEKLQYNEDFYDNVQENIPQWLKEQADSYNIDFKNYKTLCDAKLALDKEYARKKLILESAKNASDKALTIAQNSTGGTQLRDQAASLSAYDNYLEAENQLEEFEEFLDEFDTVLTTTIDFNTSWNSYGKDTSTGKESKENNTSEIDWADQSLSVLQNKVDKFQTVLDNTKGVKNQIEAINNLNSALGNLKDGYKSAYDDYKDRYEDAINSLGGSGKSIRNKIESGEEFSLIEYNSDTAEIIQDAINYYNKMLDTKEKINDVTKQINDNENIERPQVKLAGYESQLEVVDSILEDPTLTANEKNRLLEREKEIKKNILEQNLLLAETEEERLKYQQEYNNYLKDNENTQYNNKRQEISNKVGFYDSYIQDIQNKIELVEANGGQGTELQYKEMNNYLDRQIELEQINYKNALEKRNAAEWGTDEWNQYNDEIQEAQDKIHACTLAQLENNRAILLLPVQKYEKANEELQEQLDTLNEYQSKIENAIGYASTLIQDQIDILNENKENISDYWDDQIEAVQKEKDALTESNDELQRQIQLENSKYNLEKAMNNRTSRVYRKGEGFVYEADQNAIRDAQEELDNLEYNNAVNNLDKTIEALEKQKEDAITVIDEQIESWEKYAEKIDRVTNSYENFMAMQDLIQVFGSTAIADILNKDEEIIGNFELTLNSVKTDVDEIQQKIEANERLISSIQQEAEAFTSSSNNIVEAKNNIKQAIIENEEEISAIEKRRDIAKELSTTWTSTKDNIASALGNIDELNISSKDSEFETLSERIKNLQDFETKATNIYSNIVKILNKAKSAMESLNGLNDKANGTSNPSGSSNPNKTDLPNYHTGGIVGKDITSKELPKHLMSIANYPLKPNETLAKLLNGEVVLNNNQMGNLFDNLSNVLSPLASNVITKQTDTSMNISIGDVNVYNPDNSDMIVNEIVKELPLKVIQKLNSK